MCRTVVVDAQRFDGTGRAWSGGKERNAFWYEVAHLFWYECVHFYAASEGVASDSIGYVSLYSN